MSLSCYDRGYLTEELERLFMAKLECEPGSEKDKELSSQLEKLLQRQIETEKHDADCKEQEARLALEKQKAEAAVEEMRARIALEREFKERQYQLEVKKVDQDKAAKQKAAVMDAVRTVLTVAATGAGMFMKYKQFRESMQFEQDNTVRSFTARQAFNEANEKLKDINWKKWVW